MATSDGIPLAGTTLAFDSTADFPTGWTQKQNTGSWTVALANGRIEATSGINGAATGAQVFFRDEVLDMRDKCVVMENQMPLDSGWNDEWWFGVANSDQTDHSATYMYERNQLIGRQQVLDNTNIFNHVYNATNHRWFRIWLNGTTWRWHTSPTGADGSWVEVGNSALRAGLTPATMRVRLVFNRWANDATQSAKMGWFDNLNFGNPFVDIATIGAVSKYSDTTVAAESAYEYEIISGNEAGESGSSNIASATTPAATTTKKEVYLHNGTGFVVGTMQKLTATGWVTI